MIELQDSPGFRDHPVIRQVLQAALDAAEPGGAISRSMRLEGTRLSAGGREYELSRYTRVHLVSVGKAAVPLAGALSDLLGAFISRGLVVAKAAPPAAWGQRFEFIEGGHPIPDEGSLRAGQRLKEFLEVVEPDDLLICALSGGGSSLVAAPYSPINLADLQALTGVLLACGAEISEINTLRRHLDSLKGGGWLRHTRADVLSLILSDVVGSPLEAVASGPTAPDPTTRAEALAILHKYDLVRQVPAAMLRLLESAPETLKPGEPRLSNVQNVIVGNNALALQAGLKAAAGQGFNPYLLRADLVGEARDAAVELASSLRWACRRGEPVARPFCMLAGGETTVTLQGDGRGGRNTELALAAVIELAGFPDVTLVTLATDGEDGPTDAAGALVTGESWRRAEALGLQPVEFLRRNDSYTFFDTLGDLIRTGPTGTNVNDLVVLFGF